MSVFKTGWMNLTSAASIAKQKAKIQDMKVKFAAARLEFKEQITSLGTKM